MNKFLSIVYNVFLIGWLVFVFVLAWYLVRHG